MQLNARVIICLALAIVFGGIQSATAQDVPHAWKRFDAIGEADFISNQITGLCRDTGGRLWVGTDRGLVWTTDRGRNWNSVNLSYAAPRSNRRRSIWEETPHMGRDLTAAESLARNTITCLSAARSGVWVGTLNGLCYGNVELTAWDTFPPEQGGPGPEIWAVTEYFGEVWVSASNGIFKSDNTGSQWVRIEGNFPAHITTIAIGEGPNGRAIWMAGFRSQSAYGGGGDILRSEDGGRTWSLYRTGAASGAGRVLTTQVNRLIHDGAVLWAATEFGLAYSRDGGEDWHQVNRRSGLEADEVFDLAMLPGTIWVGTRDGLYVSGDKGGTWRRETSLRCPIRLLQPLGRDLWMGTSGGLIQRSVTGSIANFSVRSNVVSLAKTTALGANTWWVGTTGGLLFSRDSGRTWRALTVSDGLPSNVILSLAADGENVWAGTDGGVFFCSNYGETVRNYARTEGLRGLVVKDLAVAANQIWAATDQGLAVFNLARQQWRIYQSFWDWHCLCTKDGIVFASVVDRINEGQGIKIVSGTIEPEAWTELQVPGHEGYSVHQFQVVDEDIWMAADTGLFRTRDFGLTWARFGSDVLWSSRVTRLCPGGPNVLCVQTLPNDPPSSNSYISVTRDGGRSWSSLPEPVPGHGAAVMIVEDTIVAGGVQRLFVNTVHKGGLAAYSGFNADLKQGRTGWLMWNRLAGYASSTFRTDALGGASLVDVNAGHGPQVLFGSNGAGIIERGLPVTDPLYRSWNITGDIPLDVRPFSIFPEETFTSMAGTKDGVWFAAAGGIYFRNLWGDWTVYLPGEQANFSLPILSMAAADNLLFLGTGEGLSVFDRRTGQWTKYDAESSPILDNGVTALAYDGANLWGGTALGAFVLRPDGTWEVPFEGPRVSDIAIGAEREYFATDGGVYVRDRAGAPRRHLQNRNSSLPENNVHRVFLNGPDLWAATRAGIVRIALVDRSEPQPYPEPSPSSPGAEGVLVVINEISEGSKRIGEEYARLRSIPEKNLCRISCPVGESINRSGFEKLIRDPVRKYLFENGLAQQITCIVTTYGIPLRVRPDSDAEESAMRTDCSVDSELALLCQRHPIGAWLANPYLHREERFSSTRFGFYLVTRLDGPDPEKIIANVRKAIEIENDHTFGAVGFARFDLLDNEAETARRLNAAIMANYRLMGRQERLLGRVTPPEFSALPLFRSGSGANSFFFLGLGEGNYRPEVFTWVRGAIALTLDPANASSLEKPESSWVAGAVNDGLAATIGTVSNPGVEGTPAISQLYRYVKAGFTWAEAAYMCIPVLSWQTVVIGDPLYSPYK